MRPLALRGPTTISLNRGLGVLPFIAVIIAWYLAPQLEAIPVYKLPPIVDILQQLAETVGF